MPHLGGYLFLQVGGYTGEGAGYSSGHLGYSFFYWFLRFIKFLLVSKF